MAAAAHVITVGLNATISKSIRAWFEEFNFLPPLGLTAGLIEIVPQASIESLMRRMVASPLKNFILIIHGYEDGSGLYAKLADSQNKPHTTHFDLQRLMDRDAGGPALSPADQAAMGLTEPVVKRLLDIQHQLLDKKIECIEFRSCNLGRNKLALDRFRQFFGARLAGAPDLHTVFGLVPAVTGAHNMQTHTHFHTGPGKWTTYNFPSVLASPNLVACFALTDLNKPEYGGHIAAETDAVLDAWIKKYLKTDGRSHSGKELPVHGLWAADRIIPAANKHDHARRVLSAVIMEPEDLNDPLGGFGPVNDIRRMVFPLSDNYAKHIIYSR